MSAHRLKRLAILTTQGDAGSLHRESQFIFRYTDEALAHPERAISLTMPVRPEGYRGNRIPPVLAMQLPEGFLLDYLHARLGKAVDIRDEMNLLALVSTPNAGRVYARADDAKDPARGEPIALETLLAAPGTEDLFRSLLERYSLATAISGVQPKVVVPSRGALADKSRLQTPDLIVKTDGGEFPGLAENEFHCMTIAKQAGIEVPDFWLSDDRKLFVIRRFDRDGEGRYLGFEEMAPLTGRHADRKYEGSYGQVTDALRLNCAPGQAVESLGRFYRQFVLCCLLRNGDAHLKNWGLTYSDPVGAGTDARLSPAYDMVCTAAFIPKDTLALSLEGTKEWPGRQVLERFGRERCEVAKPGEVIDELREVVASFRPAEKTPAWKAMVPALEAGFAQAAPGASNRKGRR